MAKQLADKFGFEKVAITLRESHSAFDNDWSAMLYDVAKRRVLLLQEVSTCTSWTAWAAATASAAA